MVNLEDYGRADGKGHGSPCGLNRPKEDEHVKGSGKTAGYRCHSEYDKSRQKEPDLPGSLCNLAEDHEQAGHCNQVGGYHPLSLGYIGLKMAGDGGKSNGDHRAVDDKHEYAEQDDEGQNISAGNRQFR
jgi:hypothetical protein